MSRQLTVGSLFAGVGGFDLAAERADMKVLWQSENDKFACQTLENRFPLIPNLGDIHEVEAPPNVDVLCGGFPCQSYSVAGQRGGLADDRGALWWEFRRLISEGRPTWVVGENVPGLLSSRGGRDFAIIVDSLTELGYRVAWRVLDAQYFGVAQRRRRLFIVANSREGSPSEVLALGQGLSGDPKPSREAQPEAPGGPEGGSGGILADTGVVRSLTARFGTGGTDLTDAEAGHVVVGPLTAGMHKGPRGTEAIDSKHLIVEETSPPLMAGKNGPRYDLDGQIYIPFTQNSRDELRIIDEQNGAQIAGSLSARPGVKQQTYVFNGRQDPISTEDHSLPVDTDMNTLGVSHPVAYDEFNDAVSPGAHHTLRAGTKQSTGAIVANKVRRLTPLECERLQGFPDNWTEGRSDTQRYRQMGNAVAVPVVEWIMKRIAAQERA